MPDLPVNEYIDTAEGLARIRGNEKIYARMLGLFQQSEEFGKFEEAIASGDMNAAADVAHAIKGMTGNLSLSHNSQMPRPSSVKRPRAGMRLRMLM